MDKIYFRHFILVASILTIINAAIVVCFDLQTTRIARIITTVLFFLWFLKLNLPKNNFFVSVFVILVLSDLGILFYENKWFCYLRFISFMALYMLLSYHVIGNLKVGKIKPFTFFVIGVLLISCIFLIYSLNDIIDFETYGHIFEVIYYTYCVIAFGLVLLSILHSINSSSNKSDVFTGVVVAFVISDVLLILGYYQDFFLALQIERVFQIFGIALLLYYSVLDRRKKQFKL